MRRAVNDLLDWHAVALPGGGRVGYQDILTAIRRSDIAGACCGWVDLYVFVEPRQAPLRP